MPADRLLATKLAVPAVPRDAIVRGRLLDALDAGAQAPVTLLAAPPGYGKTALLSGWVVSGRAGAPVAWLSLDRGDVDPRRFWSAVLASLAASGAGRHVGSLEVHPREPPDLVVQALAEAFVAGDERAVLVLDDLQEAGEAVFAQLDVLVRA